VTLTPEMGEARESIHLPGLWDATQLRTPARLRVRIIRYDVVSFRWTIAPRLEGRAGLEPAPDDHRPYPVDLAFGGEC